MGRMSDDEQFESADTGSLTFPFAAGSIRKGSYMLIKGNPCKVAEVSTCKTGKHGHAKCNITGIDIFSNKKYEDSIPSSHNLPELEDLADVKQRLMDGYEKDEEMICVVQAAMGQELIITARNAKM